jgi:hypothetical protein
MISPTEFTQQWGKDGLVSYEASLVNSLNIPDVSRQFLLEAGLPKQSFITTFDLGSNTLLPLPEAALRDNWAYGLREPFPPGYARYRLLGIKSFNVPPDSFDEMFVCLDEQQEGKVVWIYNEPDYHVKLLNNTVPQLAEMLLLIREDFYNRQKLNWNNAQEAEQYFINLKRSMLAVDISSLTDDQGWSVYINNLLG